MISSAVFVFHVSKIRVLDTLLLLVLVVVMMSVEIMVLVSVASDGIHEFVKHARKINFAK